MRRDSDVAVSAVDHIPAFSDRLGRKFGPLPSCCVVWPYYNVFHCRQVHALGLLRSSHRRSMYQVGEYTGKDSVSFEHILCGLVPTSTTVYASRSQITVYLTF